MPSGMTDPAITTEIITVVTERPTAYENGKMVYQCSCGQIAATADIEASAELITDGITAFSAAAQGATVKMDFALSEVSRGS